MSCPVKTKEYKELESAIGTGRALAAWEKNGEKTPSIKEAGKLLGVRIQEPVSFEEGVEKIVKGFKSLNPYLAKGNTIPDKNVYTVKRRGYKYIAKRIEAWKTKTTRFDNVSIQVSDILGTIRFVPSKKQFEEIKDYDDYILDQLSAEDELQAEKDIDALDANEFINEEGDIVSRDDFKKPQYGTDTHRTEKITGVKFSVPSSDKNNYSRPVEEIAKSVFKDPRVLLYKGDSSYTIMGKISKLSDFQRIYGKTLGLQDISTDTDKFVGKTLQEIFNSPYRETSTGLLSIALVLASRLLQKSDSFSGRLIERLQKDGMVSNYSVRLENDVNNPFMYFDGQGIYINIARLSEEMDIYNSVEDFINAIELILTEEVIHAVIEGNITKKEREQIYNELSDKEKEQLDNSYGFNKDSDIDEKVHEYIRAIVQEDIFGTSTNREIRGKLVQKIIDALNYIIEAFKASPTPTSKLVVDKVKRYINKQQGVSYSQLAGTETKGVPNNNVSKQIEKFIEKLKGKIQYVPQIVVNGKVVPANAVADVISRTIQVIADNESIDTLPEEAAHIYVEWLPDTHPLKQEMLRTIKRLPEYRKTLSEYSKNPLYQNADGTVNTDKIAVEAIGKKIAGAIVGKADKIASTWWQKLWNFIKNIFSGKEDIWNQAATDILSANTSKLDVNAINKAAEQGRYYLQLSPEESRFYNTLSARATEAQKAIIDDLIRNPSVIFQEAGHKYMPVDMSDTTQYTSVTEGIGVEGPPNPQDYEANRQWGQDFDRILKGIVEHRDLNDIPATPTLTDKVREKIYLNMHKYITDKMSQGYIPLTQVSISDKLSGIAGTMDLVWVSPGGTIQVVDLKTSWNTVAGTSYWNNPHLLKDTSKIKISDRIAITKKQQHAIQVNAYTKMLQIMGYHKVTAPVTKHYRVAHDNAGTVIDFVDESTVEHKPSEMEAAVNMLIPTQIGTENRLEKMEVENPLDTKEFQEDKEKVLNEEEPAAPTYTEEEKKSLQGQVREIVDTLKAYKNLLAERSKQRADANSSAVEDINNLLQNIYTSLGSGDWEASYIQFLDYANNQTAHLIGYINNPANYNATTPEGKARYRTMVPRAQHFVKALQNVLQVHSFVKNNPTMLNLSLTLGDLVNNAQNSIDEAYKRIVGNNIIGENTTNPLLTNSVIAEKLTKDVDIQYLDAWASDLTNIGNATLENFDKDVKLTSEKMRKEGEKTKERIAEMGEKLAKVAGTRDAKTLYDVMFQRDSKGNKTGRMLSMIGDKYWKMRDEIIAGTRNLDGRGEPLQYITNPKTQEELDYNIKLSKAKKRVFDFQNPEIRTYNRETKKHSYEDGRFHYLSAEYKAERDKVLVFEGGMWKVQEGKEQQAREFRNKYMTFESETYRMQYDNNDQPTGYVTENTDGVWYPKREHVVIRAVAADGTDMRDPVWKKLREGKTPLEKAQMEYLEEYRDILGEQVDHLGPKQRDWYQKHYLPAVASNFLQQLGNSPKKMELVMNELKEWFTLKGYASQTEVQRMTGSLSQSLPAIYTANMQSQERLDRIVAEISEHNLKKESIKTNREKVEWTNKAKELEDMRKRELSRLTPDQIHPDLTQGLMAFTDMTHKFRVVDAISDNILAIENVLTNTTFYENRRDAFGKIIKVKDDIKGVDSKTYKRFITYVQQIWENDESMNKEMLDVIINKAMKGTSAIGMAFNWLGHIHNVVTGQINNTIDSFGDELYTRKANMRMKLEVNKAMAAKAVQAGQLLGKSYKTPPAASKYEAFVREFNMVEHMANSDPGKVGVLDWGYGTMQLGEWVVQSRVGNAILDSIILTDPQGNEVSVYDAYEFEATTGKLTIKPGYKIQATGAEFNEKERLKIHNRIRETNKRIHGNYRDIDRTSIERYSIGKMVMQFHKWIYPAYKARFQRGKWDENLGAEGMFNEGRYRSAGAFIRGLYNKTITLEQMWKGTMEDVSKMSAEDKKKFIREHFEGVISAEEYKNFDDKVKLIDNLIEAHENTELFNRDTPEHRAAWNARLEELLKEKEQVEQAVEDMMFKLLEHRKKNIIKAAADLLYICILFGTFTLLKGIADDLPDDDPLMKKVTNWMMWEADRNKKEVSLFVPGVNLVEAYQLIKSPIAALGAVRDFGQVMNAMIQYPFQNETERHLQRGPHEGEAKVWKETTDLIPIWRQYNRWLSFDNINNFYIK